MAVLEGNGDKEQALAQAVAIRTPKANVTLPVLSELVEYDGLAMLQPTAIARPSYLQFIVRYSCYANDTDFLERHFQRNRCGGYRRAPRVQFKIHRVDIQADFKKTVHWVCSLVRC